MIIAVGLVAAVLTASDGSVSQASTPHTIAETSSSIPGPQDVLICRKVSETGTRLGGVKVCKTRREWALTSRISEDAVNAQQRRSFNYTIPDRMIVQRQR